MTLVGCRDDAGKKDAAMFVNSDEAYTDTLIFT
jgi:hypothetical protein